jgi:hypothetical protein
MHRLVAALSSCFSYSSYRPVKLAPPEIENDRSLNHFMMKWRSEEHHFPSLTKWSKDQSFFFSVGEDRRTSGSKMTG